MMAEIQDVHMFKKKSLRVTMFRMMLETYREIFELHLQELLQMFNAANVQYYNCSEKGHYARNCPKLRVRDSKYFMEQMLLAKQDEEGKILTDEQNDFLFTDASSMEEIEELSANICLMAKIQPANFDFDVRPSYDSAFLSEVLETDINKKGQKQSQNGQNQAQNEKSVKKSMSTKVKSKPKL
ncbi:retrovirus-related pol polyprotein from transposon TNT 1-94 [Tanacetum coccineum]